MEQKAAFFDDIPMEARPGVRYWVPAAAMEERDFREEIRQLFRRGFGRIELVVLSGRNSELDHSEDGWGTENWDKMVRVAADETCFVFASVVFSYTLNYNENGKLNQSAAFFGLFGIWTVMHRMFRK